MLGTDLHGCQDIGLIGLNDAAIHDHLVQNEVRLLNIKHYVELAHIFEVLVQCLYQIVNEFEER